MLREIKSNQRKVRVIHLVVDGTGTAAITSGSKSASLVDNGTGDYSITPNQAGARLLNAQVTPIADAGDLIGTLHSDTAASVVRVMLWDGTDGTTAKDGKFHLQIVLSDDADEQNG
jgi:hypothetical protein